MKAIDVANTFIANHGDKIELTNLKLNKLVYYAQVECLRAYGEPLFDDPIEAWQYGPVERAVYHAFKTYGRGRIAGPSASPVQTDRSRAIVARVAQTYGTLLAFDLVSVSHREGGAWRNVYDASEDRVITLEDIRQSSDMDGFDAIGDTFGDQVAYVRNALPDTIKMLENS